MATRTQYRTMQGKLVDLGQIIAKNELTTAVGNAGVNARGDELGPGGKIVRKREDVMAEYYKNKGNSLPDAMPHRNKTVPAPKHLEAAVPVPTYIAAPAVDDLSPDELDFNDPEPEVTTNETSKRRRATQ
jgi:hypothetical protein